MLRVTLQADEDTDVEVAIGDLRQKCDRAGLAGPSTEALISQARMAMQDFIERGRQLAQIGSQMRAARDINGEGLSIKLVFGAGFRRSLFDRILDKFRGR